MLWSDVVPDADRDAFFAWMDGEGIERGQCESLRFDGEGESLTVTITRYRRDERGRRYTVNGKDPATEQIEHVCTTPAPLTPALRSCWIDA